MTLYKTLLDYQIFYYDLSFSNFKYLLIRTKTRLKIKMKLNQESNNQLDNLAFLSWFFCGVGGGKNYGLNLS